MRPKCKLNEVIMSVVTRPSTKKTCLCHAETDTDKLCIFIYLFWLHCNIDQASFIFFLIWIAVHYDIENMLHIIVYIKQHQ